MVTPVDPNDEPANLRFLRRLVTVLTSVMIAGMIAVVVLLVMRLSETPIVLPDDITLPDETKAEAVTITETWYAVVTGDGTRLLVFRRSDGRLLQEIAINQQ